MKPTLSQVKALVEQLAVKINAPEKLLPTYGNSIDDGHPYIEIESGILFYLAKERGIEVKRYVALDLDDLLYHIFKDIMFTMATNYELKNRIKGQDFRRILFAEQERLLGSLDKKWALKQHKEHESILADHPFDDNVGKE